MIPLLRRAYWLVVGVVVFYFLAILALLNPTIHRQLIYLHKVNTVWIQDPNKPDQFGFARNQVTPFNFSTVDHETLYAWHVLPLGLYAKHEAEMLKEPLGCAEDILETKAFQLLQTDKDARLIIFFHGNAGSVSQGWRPSILRALTDGSTSNNHALIVDYRGFGYSSGFPTEAGLIIDGISTVNWALNVAGIPPDRIVLIGHSLGGAVTSAVAEEFAKKQIEFAGLILISAFSNLTSLLRDYAIGGWIPILGPIKRSPALQRFLLTNFLVDLWPSTERIANLVRISKRLKLFIIHSRSDPEISWLNSEELFVAAANATTSGGMDAPLLAKVKARNTVDLGDGGFISTWKASPEKTITEIISRYGRHNTIASFTSTALAILKIFDVNEGKEAR